MSQWWLFKLWYMYLCIYIHDAEEEQYFSQSPFSLVKIRSSLYHILNSEESLMDKERACEPPNKSISGLPQRPQRCMLFYGLAPRAFCRKLWKLLPACTSILTLTRDSYTLYTLSIDWFFSSCADENTSILLNILLPLDLLLIHQSWPTCDDTDLAFAWINLISMQYFSLQKWIK